MLQYLSIGQQYCMKTKQGITTECHNILKTTFSVPFQSRTPPHDIICLYSNNCLLVYHTECVIVSLQQKQITKVIDFGIEINEVIPMNEGFLVVLYDGQQAKYIMVESNQENKQIIPRKFIYNNLIYFSKSNEVFEKAQVENTKQLISLKNQKRIPINNLDKVSKGDDKQWTILGNKFKKWRFKNLLTGQLRTVVVNKIYWMLYIVDNKSTLGLRKSEPTEKNVYIAMDKITEEKQKQTKEVMRFDGYGKASFGWMDSDQKIVMIMLEQPVDAPKFNILGQIVLVNYETNVKIWSCITDITYKSQYKMCPDFSHFVQMREKGNSVQISDYYNILNKDD